MKLIFILPLKFSYSRLIFLTVLATAMVMNVLKSTVAQTSKPIAENFPDGIYLYGETPVANQPGSNYITFRKSGNRLMGSDYIRNSDAGMCFKGEIKGNLIQDAFGIERGPDIMNPQYTLIKKEAIDLNKYYKIDELETGVDLKKVIENCEDLFKTMK